MFSHQNENPPGCFSNKSSSSLDTTTLSLSLLSITNITAIASLKNTKKSIGDEVTVWLGKWL